MFLLISLFTFLFVCVSFLSNLENNTSNYLYSYFLIQISFVLQNIFIVILGYFVFVGIFIKISKFEKNYSFGKKIRDASIHLFQVIILSLFSSYLFLYLLAVIHLNILSIFYNNNPKSIGIESDTKIIVENLKSNDVSPKIIINDLEENKTIVSVAQATSNKNTYYGKFVLQSIPSFLILPSKNNDPTFILIDKTLIITKLNLKDLQLISPVLGHLFVKDYFGNKSVKAYPKISIMNNKDYQKYRKEAAEKRILKINDQIIKIQTYISTTSASIENDKLQIAKIEALQALQENKSESRFNKCLEYYDTVYCKTIVSNLDKKTKSDNKELDDWKEQLKLDEALLRVYDYYDKFYKTQKESLKNFKNIAIFEQGVFEPENNIKARLDDTSSHSIADFLSVVIHEYFHYASYTKDKKFSNTFFEEGLAEYFSRQVLNYNLNISPNLGYPIQAKIVSQFSNRIAENELVKIFFSKDDLEFEKVLDRVYGRGFYQKNLSTFEALQYATTPDQLVKLANDIMVQIDGEKINRKDYFGTSTKL